MSQLGNPVRYLDSNRPVTDDRELLLDQYSNEVLMAWEEMTIIADKIRTITFGPTETQQFIATGFVGTEYHTPGVEIFGQDARVAQRKVTLDDQYLTSAIEYHDIDALLSHFDVRGEWANKQGYALARTVDLHALAQLARTSLINVVDSSGVAISASSTSIAGNYQTAAVDPKIGTPGGSIIIGDFVGDTGADRAINIYDAIVEASRILDRKDCPKSPRYCVLPTDTFYDLRWGRNSSGQFVNMHVDYMDSGMANKTGAPEMVFNINGIVVYESNRFPRTSVSGGNPAKYDFPWADLHGIVWYPEATVMAMKQGIAIETFRDGRRMTDVVIAKLLEGHGSLRPECVITIWDDRIGTEGGATNNTAGAGAVVNDLAWTVTSAFNL
jgi:hypothetical protein